MSRIIRTTTELAIHNERAEQMAESGLSTESIERLKNENTAALRRWESLPKNKRAHTFKALSDLPVPFMG